MLSGREEGLCWPVSPALHGGYLFVLQVGDRIVTICGTSTEGMTHTQAVNLMKNASGSIEMQVRLLFQHSSEYRWPGDTGAPVLNKNDSVSCYSFI